MKHIHIVLPFTLLAAFCMFVFAGDIHASPVRVMPDGTVLTSEGSVLGKTDNRGQVISEEKKSAKPENPGIKDVSGEKKEIPPVKPVQTIQKDAKGLLKIETKENTMKVQTVSLSDNGDEATETSELVIEEPEEQNTVRVRTEQHSSYVIRNKIAAQTKFPLMVNLETNELIVTTPKGSKVVTVLPDQAVMNMLAANVLDQAGGKGGYLWLEYQKSIATPSSEMADDPDSTESASPVPAEPDEEATPEGDLALSPTPTAVYVPQPEDHVVLTTLDDGTLVYAVPGTKTKKLFGFRHINLNRIAVVSAETGELIRVEQDLLTRILDALSTE